MFKRVEDDVLLGVSKVITRNIHGTGNLLIDEAKLSETKIEEDNEVIDEDTDSLSNDINEKEIPSGLVHRDEYNEMKEELLSSLKEHIAYLKEQIDTKDKQLQNKDELIRNFQVLMKSDKDRIHELEAGKIEDENEDINSEIEVEIKEPSSSVETASETTKDIDTSEVTTKKRGLLSWFRK